MNKDEKYLQNRIHDYLLQHVGKYGSSSAIISYNKKISYLELSSNACNISRLLKKNGLKEGQIILLILYPCPEAIELIIACSMLGLAFVPLNPEDPHKKIEHIIENTYPALIISHKKFQHCNFKTLRIKNLNAANICIVKRKFIDPSREEKYRSEIIDKKIAYIIFTSGTTGEPKGVIMSHKAVINFFSSYSKYGITRNDRIGTISPLQFDFSLCDMGITLGNGATLVIVPQLLLYQPSQFIRFLCDYKITQMNGVPSIWNRVITDYKEALNKITLLNTIMYAGELFPINQLRILCNSLPALRIVQGFGHSESIGCSYKILNKQYIENNSHMSIGRSIDKLEMFLIDVNNNEIKDAYVKGQLCIKGTCLFNGYWQDQTETNRVLQAEIRKDKKGGLVFYTGDLASFDKAGDFYFHGRMDSQVKINGYRIEVEGIDNVLGRHGKILQAATVVSVIEGADKLISFVVPRDKDYNEQGLTELLRDYCANIFPRYMLPSAYTFVESLPCTANGKVDYKRVKEMLSTV